MSLDEMEIEKWEFEKEKYERDFQLRERELKLKELEARIIRSRIIGMKAIVIVAIFGILGACLAVLLQNYSSLFLQRKRSESAKIATKEFYDGLSDDRSSHLRIEQVANTQSKREIYCSGATLPVIFEELEDVYGVPFLYKIGEMDHRSIKMFIGSKMSLREVLELIRTQIKVRFFITENGVIVRGVKKRLGIQDN